MQINRATRRRPAALEGVRLSVGDDMIARSAARTLTGDSSHLVGLELLDLRVIRDGLAAEIERLEAAEPWTESGSEVDEDRERRLRRAFILIKAVEYAIARTDG